MLANWVKETTATTGTGAISLGGAVAGHIAFSDAFRDGDAVYYSVEDGNNREIGIGTMSAGTPWTLTRTTVLETLVNGVFTRGAASPISLSGSAVVMVAVATEHLKVLPRRSGDAIEYLDESLLKSTGQLVCVADEMWMVPVYLRFGVLVDDFRVAQLAVAATIGTKMRLGMYAVDAQGYPTRLIAEGGDIDTTTTGFAKGSPLTTPVEIPPGYYFIALLADGDPTVLTIKTGYQHFPLMIGFGASTAYNYSIVSTAISSGWSSLPTSIDPANISLVKDYDKMPVIKIHGVFR